MSATVRLRRKRTPGFSLQAASLALNGLECVVVTRPGKWGNPLDFSNPEYCWIALSFGCRGDKPGRQKASVIAFNHWINPGEGKLVISDEVRIVLVRHDGAKVPYGPAAMAGKAPSLNDVRHALAGKNLACWCALCPAHATTGKPFGVECTECAPCHADVLGVLASTPPKDDL